MLIEEVECRARAREKEKAALMLDAKLEVAYNTLFRRFTGRLLQKATPTGQSRSRMTWTKSRIAPM